MAQFSIIDFIDRIALAFREGDPEVHSKRAEAQNIQLLQEQYRAIARGDFGAALDLLAEDVEFEITGPPAVPFLGRWRGRAEVGEAIGRNFAMVEDQEPEVHAVVAQGDTVIVVARERGRVRASGRPYELHWVQLFTYRDGKAVRIREIVDGYAM
jgi:ketosteroid isomerase-like protein